MAKNARNPRLNGFSSSFILRTSYLLKNDEHPIVLKLTYLGDRKEINTGLSCLASEWLAGKGMVHSKRKEAATINKELINIQIRFEELFMKMKLDLVDFTLDELIERAKGKNTPPQNILDYIKQQLDDFQSRVGVDIAKTTYYKYRRTATYFTDYLALKKSTTNLPVSRIDEALLEDFFLFLRKEKKNGHNSSVALMNCLRTILDKPVKDGVIRINPFRSVSLTRKPVIRDYLTMDELRALQNLSGLSEAMERNRDLFLFACFTGMSYADIYDFRSHHIIIEPDGAKHIEFYRNKTGVISYIPLISAAENILLNYSSGKDCRDFQWKVPSNQKLNQSLKLIAQLSGIHKPLFMHLGRHTFATTVTLSQGVSIESVSKMLGHTTLKHTQLYAKIVNNRVKKDMEGIRNSFV
jgi:site-specific recombinase XerD